MARLLDLPVEILQSVLRDSSLAQRDKWALSLTNRQIHNVVEQHFHDQITLDLSKGAAHKFCRLIKTRPEAEVADRVRSISFMSKKTAHSRSRSHPSYYAEPIQQLISACKNLTALDTGNSAMLVPSGDEVVLAHHITGSPGFLDHLRTLKMTLATIDFTTTWILCLPFLQELELHTSIIPHFDKFGLGDPHQLFPPQSLRGRSPLQKFTNVHSQHTGGMGNLLRWCPDLTDVTLVSDHQAFNDYFATDFRFSTQRDPLKPRLRRLCLTSSANNRRMPLLAEVDLASFTALQHVEIPLQFFIKADQVRTSGGHDEDVAVADTQSILRLPPRLLSLTVSHSTMCGAPCVEECPEFAPSSSCLNLAYGVYMDDVYSALQTLAECKHRYVPNLKRVVISVTRRQGVAPSAGVLEAMKGANIDFIW